VGRGRTLGGVETLINTITLGTAESFGYLMWSGVFDRHPKLTVVSVESGIGWLGYFRERANNVYKRHRHWTHSGLKNEPGYYFGRNIFATFEEDLVGIRTRDVIGVDALLWSSDYPHNRHVVAEMSGEHRRALRRGRGRGEAEGRLGERGAGLRFQPAMTVHSAS